jgi:hypothetical protein
VPLKANVRKSGVVGASSIIDGGEELSARSGGIKMG